MLKTTIVIFLTAFLFGCNQNKKNFLQEALNPDHLKEQTFLINTTVDTIIKTASGIKISITANSIKSTSNTVTLQVKEALTMQQILLAGLVTESDKGILRSGGMVNIKTKEKSSILKSIQVSVPTNNIDKGMQLYKGEVDKDNKIEWKEPEPIESFDTSFSLSGENLFKQNCRSCHAINYDLTGPALKGIALKGITKRVSKEWLYAFTRNPDSVIHSGDKYADRLYIKWNMTQMNAFPSLSRNEIDAIYAYVESDSSKDERFYDTNDEHLPEEIEKCLDSCYKFKEARLAMNNQLDLLKSIEQPLSTVNYSPGTVQVNPIESNERVNNSTVLSEPDKVVINPVVSDYYNFSIDAFGWYNIDMLLDNKDFENCNLIVSIIKPQNAKFQTYLVVPSIKLFVEGGELKGGSGYGFYSVNGDIPLPEKVDAYVFAVGEVDGKSLFGMSRFLTSKSQNIKVDLKVLPKEEIVAAFKAYKFENLNFQVDTVKNRTEIKSLKNKIDSLDIRKLEYCKCVPEADSAQAPTGSVEDYIIDCKVE